MARAARRDTSRGRAARPPLALEGLESRDTPAAVGSPDPSFGTAGTVTTSFGVTDRAAAVALQPDGKIVVVGTDATVMNIEVVRYNPDGSLDASFASGGRRYLASGGADVGTAVAVQADGKIVVAGYTSLAGTAGNPNNFEVFRVNADGTSDTSFGTGGLAVVDFGGDDRAAGVAVQADGRVVVGGSTTPGTGGGDFAVARLTTAGTPDTSFNATGRQTVDFGGADAANAVALQADGAIVLAGSTGPTGVTPPAVAVDFAVARLTAAGLPDASFNTTGRATADFGFSDVANAVAVQPDGKIVLAGTATGTSPDFAVARFLTGGGLDPTFNTNGKVEYNIGADDRAAGVAVQPDGKIVVAGTTNTGTAAGATGVVLRLSPAGLQDPAIGPASTAPFGAGTQVAAAGVALTPTGRIVVASTAQVTGTAGTSALVVSRLVGTVEAGRNLVVGGSLNGAATVYATIFGTLGYNPTPVATVSALGGPAANVRTAVADVNGDGVQDVIVVTGPGTPIRVAVVSGVDNKTVLVPAFDPFGGNFTGGGFVAAADLNNDGRAEFMVTPDQGGGPRVTVFSLPATGGLVTLASFLGVDDAGFRNGVYVAAGDVDGDGKADLIIGAGPGGGPRVLILGGARLTATGAASALSTPLSNFFVAGTDSDRGGVRVAAVDIEGDAKADVVVGTGTGQPSRFRVYAGVSFTTTGEPTVFQDLDPYSQTFADGVYVG